MEKIPGEGSVGRSLTLSDFRFMVGEDVVFATGMNIESFSEIFDAHSATFDMPARVAFTPGGGPLHEMAFWRSEPQGKIPRVLFVRMLFQPGAYFQVFQSIAG